MSDAVAQLEEVRANIARAEREAGRPAGSVALVAVSKTFDADAIRPVLAAGQRVFGENRVQEAQAKWPGLRREFPDIELHLVMEDRELDLAQRQADLAVRLRAPVQADLIQRKLFTVHYHMYAAREYLARHPAPEKLEDIADHTIIVYGETAAPEIRDINWLLDNYRKYQKPGSKGRILRINNITGILQAVEAGLGIGVVPDYVAAGHDGLVKVMPELPALSFDAHLVYADAMRQSKRVAAFRDFLVKAAKDWNF